MTIFIFCERNGIYCRHLCYNYFYYDFSLQTIIKRLLKIGFVFCSISKSVLKYTLVNQQNIIFNIAFEYSLKICKIFNVDICDGYILLNTLFLIEKDQHSKTTQNNAQKMQHTRGRCAQSKSKKQKKIYYRDKKYFNNSVTQVNINTFFH